ncbi:MAG: hypothetical protein AB1568_16315 [Thermodesulfobacteriota bacterium]
MKETANLNWFDRIMMAISFAEANEAETARAIMNADKKRDVARPGAGQRPGTRPSLRV